MLVSDLVPCVHTNDAPYDIPISVISNPVAHHDPCTAISPSPFSLFVVLQAQILNNCGIQFRRDAIRPATDFPKITRRQEIDHQRLFRFFVRKQKAWRRIFTSSSSLKVLNGVLNLLLNILRFQHLIKILDADIPTSTQRIWRIVCPARSIDAPARTPPFGLKALIKTETPYENNLTAGFA